MKSTFLKILSFIAIIVVSDRVIGLVCKELYARSKDFTISKLRYTMESTKEDVLILGSSRAEYHFIPTILRDTTGLSIYNCGIGGADLLFSRIQLNESLKRYKPKFVVVEVSPSSFFIPNAESNRKMLLPFYKKDTLIYSTLTENKLFEKVKFLSSVYPYNSTIASLVKGVVSGDPDLYNGFVPSNGLFDTSNVTGIVNKAYAVPSLPAEKFDYLKQLIEDCNNHQVGVIIISAPLFRGNPNHDEMVNQIRTFCSAYKNLTYLDYSKYEKTYGKNDLFKDNTHLNYEGAKLFSVSVAQELKRISAGNNSFSSLK